MNQTFSILMAVIMALTGICGTLGDLNVETPVSADVSFGIDGDFAAMVSGAQAETVAAAIPKILDALSLHFALDPSALQLEVRAEDGSLASVALKKQEEGWAVASGILPNTVITVKQETLDQMARQMMASFSSGEDAPASVGDILSKIDFQAVRAALESAWNGLQNSIEEKYREPEAGDFEVNGIEYTQCAVCSITVPELKEIIMGATEKLLADESIVAAFSAFGQQVPPAANFNFMLNVPDEMDLSITRYTNDAENSCTVVNMSQEEAALILWLAETGETATVSLLLNRMDEINMDALLTVDRAKENYELDVSAAGNGQTMHIKAGFATVEEGANANLFATVPVPDHDPVTIRADLKLRHEAPAFEAPEEATVIELEKLMNPEEESSAELSAHLVNDLKLGLFSTAAKLFILVPDLSSLVDLSTLMPGSVTVETPDDGPVEVEEEPAEEVTVEKPEEVPSEEVPVDGAAA